MSQHCPTHTYTWPSLQSFGFPSFYIFSLLLYFGWITCNIARINDTKFHETKDAVICSDSRSALAAITNLNHLSILAYEIQLITGASIQKKKIISVWVPVHARIYRNREANRLAKSRPQRRKKRSTDSRSYWTSESRHIIKFSYYGIRKQRAPYA